MADLVKDGFPFDDDGTKAEVYSGSRYRNFFKELFTDGVFINVGREFDINISATNIVEVFNGRATLGGLLFNGDIVGDINDSDKFTIVEDVVGHDYYIQLTADSTVPAGGTATIDIIQVGDGVPYEPTKNINGVYGLLLYKIVVPAGGVNIESGDITDLRVFNKTITVNHVEEAQFDGWNEWVVVLDNISIADGITVVDTPDLSNFDEYRFSLGGDSLGIYIGNGSTDFYYSPNTVRVSTRASYIGSGGGGVSRSINIDTGVITLGNTHRDSSNNVFKNARIYGRKRLKTI